MNKGIFAYLFVTMLLCSMCYLMRFCLTANGQGVIIVDGEDYQSTELLQYPTGIPIVNPLRIVLEYEDYSSITDIQAPDNLTLPSVSRIVVEYADFMAQTDIASPQGIPSMDISRIVIEYADYSNVYDVAPYVGPQPMGHNDTSPPVIGILTRIPSDTVTVQDNVIVFADISDVDGGVKNATLQYSIDNGTSWSDVPMILNMANYTNSLSESFYGMIPNQSNDTWVTFRVGATDYAWNTASRDGEAPYSPYQVVPEFPSAVLFLWMAMLLMSAMLLNKKRSNMKLHRPD